MTFLVAIGWSLIWTIIAKDADRDPGEIAITPHLFHVLTQTTFLVLILALRGD
jgi:hypothetical protein